MMRKTKMKYLSTILLIVAIVSIPGYSSISLIVEQDTANPLPNIQVERWNIFQLKLDGPQNGNPFFAEDKP